MDPYLQYVPIHADPRKLTEFQYRRYHLFYSANSMSRLPELLHIFRDYLMDEILYTSVIIHTNWPAFRKDYFLHKIVGPTYSKWALLFKHLLRFFSWDAIGDFLFPAFCYIGLRTTYFQLITHHPSLYPKRFLPYSTVNR